MNPGHRVPESNLSHVHKPKCSRIKPQSWIQATGFQNQTSVMFPGHRVPQSNLSHIPRTQGSTIKPQSWSQATGFHNQISVMFPGHRVPDGNLVMFPGQRLPQSNLGPVPRTWASSQIGTMMSWRYPGILWPLIPTIWLSSRVQAGVPWQLVPGSAGLLTGCCPATTSAISPSSLCHLPAQLSSPLGRQGAVLSSGHLRILTPPWSPWPQPGRCWNRTAGNPLVVHWLRLCTSTAGDMGVIPDRGTKIPHAVRHSQKKKKKRKKEIGQHFPTESCTDHRSPQSALCFFPSPASRRIQGLSL